MTHSILVLAIVLVLAHAGHTAIASGERLFRAILRRCFEDPPIPSVPLENRLAALPLLPIFGLIWTFGGIEARRAFVANFARGFAKTATPPEVFMIVVKASLSWELYYHWGDE